MGTLFEVLSHNNFKEIKTITEWASVSCTCNFILGAMDFMLYSDLIQNQVQCQLGREHLVSDTYSRKVYKI